MTESVLRPITIPLPLEWTNLNQLKSKLKLMQQELITSTSTLVPSSSSSKVADRPTETAEKTSEPLKEDAEQRKDGIQVDRQALEKAVIELEKDIQKRETALKSKPIQGLLQGWGVNERGELLNDEGLPMMDIREEVESDSDTARPEAAAAVSSDNVPKPRSRYLTKDKGTLTLGPARSYDVATTPSLKVDSQALFDQLEKEEEEEAKVEAERKLKEPAPPTSGSFIARARPKTAASSSPAASSSSPGIVPTPSKTPSTPFLASFSSGFLKGKTSSPATASSSSTIKRPVPKQIVQPTPIPTEPTLHEPRHHSLPPAKSIYRPTPPSTAPSTRPSSPRLDRRVAFDVPVEADKPAKPAKSVIILPDVPSSSAPAPPPVATKTMKDTVIERPLKAPIAPSVKPKTTSRFGSERTTIGRPPRASTSTSTAVTPTIIERPTAPPVAFSARTTAPVARPIHTISLSSSSSAADRNNEGEASLRDLGWEAEEEVEEEEDIDENEGVIDVARPMHLPSDSEESDSSGFYGEESDDEDDDDDDDIDEIDIDGALHAREVALEYHRLRSGLGAGAGTGPLGGDREPDAYHSWNQSDVPIDATLQGRTAGSGRASRFRTGRLESTQMIIPSLLAMHVTDATGEAGDSDDDDDMTPEERERVRRTLAMLAGTSVDLPLEAGEACTIQGKRIGSSETRREEIRSPGVGVRSGVPISVPSNGAVPPVVTAAVDPPVKMSRFKARQLGIRLDE